MKEVLLTSSVLILALLGLRALFRGAVSRRAQYALWGLVLVRLLVPVSLPAMGHSVLTAAEPVGQTVTATLERPALYIPVDRAPLTDHPAAPDLRPQAAMPEDASSVWVAETDETAVRYCQLSAGTVLTGVWLAGAAAMAVWLLAVNLRFRRRLWKGRTPYTVDGCKYPVYLVETGLPSPCLFGLFRPAVYLTPAAAASPETLRHVLAHETAHARQGDPLWSLLRCVCLAVYWFDPLVWAAALASRTDCELACDERALLALGEAERIPYGRTLLALVPVRRGPSAPLLAATTMTAGKRHLRDRIARIAENRQTRAAALFAVLALAAGVCAVTFTGGRPAEPRPLTGDELAYFNEAFFNNDTAGNVAGVNIRNQFLTSLYASPEEIDLFELFYCGVSDKDDPESIVGSGEDENRLVYGDNLPDCACYKASTADMDAILAQYTGLTVAETNGIGLDSFTYLPEYDAYYWAHGDTNYFHSVHVTAGEREGGILRLYYPDSFARYPDCDWLCVTLEAQADGSYWFVSNLPAEKPAIPTVYPEGDPALTIPLDGLTPYAPPAVERRRFTAESSQVLERHISGGATIVVCQTHDRGLAVGLDGGDAYDCFLTFTALQAESLPDILIGDFDGLLGRSGFVVSYQGKVKEWESHVASGDINAHTSITTFHRDYDTINDYYYIDDSGAPVLLARAYGTPEIIDLDGDGQNELAAASGNTAQVFFQRDGQVYEVSLDALLADAWPEATYLNLGVWDANRRNLSFSGEVPIPGTVMSGTAERHLYFDGERLLAYRENAVYSGRFREDIQAPEAVLDAVRDYILPKYEAGEDGYKLVDGEFQVPPPHITYDDWRVTELEGPFRETVGGLTLDIWQLGYELHVATPEQISLAGARYITEDGWASQGSPSCDYLYFTVNTNSAPTLLFTAIENDCSLGSTMFFSDMVYQLVSMDLLTMADLNGQQLLDMCSTQPVDFLNRLAERPEAEAALETLGAYLASSDLYDVQEAWESCTEYVGLLGKNFTDAGRAAWERLNALASGPAADPAGDFRDFTPPEVLAAALEAAEADYNAFRAWADGQYDGWRLTYLAPVTGYEPFQNVPLEIYNMGWKAHAVKPEAVGLVGGMAVDPEGWVGGMYIAPYLVFLNENGHYRLLGRDIASDVSPDAPFFRADLADILLDQGLVTPEDIGARTLISMFRGGSIAFLNRVGALPQDQQTDVVEALASFHHQGLFFEEGELRDAIQTAVWSQEDLDAGGGGLLRALLDRTGIQAYGVGDSYDRLDAAIHQSLLDRRANASAHKDDFYAVSHRVLDTYGTGCTTTVCLLTCFGSYDAGRSGGYTLETSGVTPVSLTFAQVNGMYQLTEYWEPLGGTAYADEIRLCFPEEAADAAIDPDPAILENLQSRMERSAAEHFAEIGN